MGAETRISAGAQQTHTGAAAGQRTQAGQRTRVGQRTQADERTRVGQRELRRNARSRSELPTTVTLDSAIAAPAIIGSSRPDIAIGIAMTL